jgi:lipopolysaccharide/colanic/teichoic acid biosynthesis glycosyltransferase
MHDRRPGPPRSRSHRAAKRTLDILLSLLALVLLAPLMTVIALAIFGSDPRGGVLFRQRRTGKGGRTFSLYKFRTMRRDADALKEALRHRSEVPWPDFRVSNDPRVTRIGRGLRRTSLDELPQLVNVLLGSMSLVGPRPTSFAASTYALWQTERLAFRPGLTGPWQVQGRRSMDFADRSRLEIAYFRRARLRDDLAILLATVRVVLRGTGTA